MPQMTRRTLVDLLIAGTLVAVATGVAAGQNASQATRNDSQGGITLKAVYLTTAYFKASPSDPLMGKVDPERNVVFAITLDTHSGDLSRYEFVKNAAVRNDRGQQVSPLRWVATVEGTHHRAGGLVFPKTDQSGRTIDAGTKTVELVVRDLGTVSERTLPLDASCRVTRPLSRRRPPAHGGPTICDNQRWKQVLQFRGSEVTTDERP